jgi:uncharacterized membrane protein (UPF0127 family)
MPRIFLLALLMLSLGWTGNAASQAVLPQGVPPMEFGRDVMAITTDKGRFVYDIEVAVTPDQQARGLMWRPVLGPNKGMLFIFGQERGLSFWMQNTLIPLDMVFIDNKGQLVSIQRQAKPRTRTPRPSDGPARFVLEIDGGEAEALGIDADTTFEFGAATLQYLAASRLPYGG